jgi:hypothetical protein
VLDADAGELLRELRASTSSASRGAARVGDEEFGPLPVRLGGEHGEEVELVRGEQQQVTVDARLPLLRVDGDRAGGDSGDSPRNSGPSRRAFFSSVVIIDTSLSAIPSCASQ